MGGFVFWGYRMIQIREQIRELQSDDLPWSQGLASLCGQKVNSNFGVGTIVQLRDGTHGIKVRLLCQHEGCRKTRTFYLGPGPGGPDHYAYNIKGKYMADLRDQSWVCPAHRE
jgi:hypothetical protein